MPGMVGGVLYHATYTTKGTVASWLYPMTENVTQQYAHYHNYYFLTRDMCGTTPVYPVAWTKVFMLLDCMKKYPELTHLLWIDADALIVNPSQTLDALLPSHCNVSMRSHAPFASLMNSGVMLWRRTSWSIKILREVTRRHHNGHDSGDWEQTPLNRAASGGVCEESRLQSMPFFNQIWRPDTFALHFNPLSRNKQYPSSDLFRARQRAGPAYLVLWNATTASGCDLEVRNAWKENG